MVPCNLLLTGEYEHKLDAKNRLSIPSELRNFIYPETNGFDFYLVFGPNKILCLYPSLYYRQLVGESMTQLVRPAGQVDFERVNFALTCFVGVDDSRRVGLPARMMERAGLGKDVVLIGARDHIEIWNAKVWKEYLAEHLENHEELLELGREVKKGAAVAADSTNQHLSDLR